MYSSVNSGNTAESRWIHLKVGIQYVLFLVGFLSPKLTFFLDKVLFSTGNKPVKSMVLQTNQFSYELFVQLFFNILEYALPLMVI